MPRDLASRIRIYAAMVGNLHLYDDELEITNALVWRDSIQETLDGGAEPKSENLARLEGADQRLVKLRAFIAERFPEVFEDRGAPSDYWWWHLDEGPQVREEALAAAKDQA